MFADAIERIDTLNRNITIHRHKLARIIKRVKTIATQVTKTPKLLVASNITQLLDLIDELESTLIKKPGDMLRLSPEKFSNYNKKLRTFAVNLGKLSGLEELFSKVDDEADDAADIREIKDRGHAYPYDPEKSISTDLHASSSKLAPSASLSSFHRTSNVQKSKSGSTETNLLRKINSSEVLVHSSSKRSLSNLFGDNELEIQTEKEIPRLSRQKDIQKKSLPQLPITDQDAEAL